MRGAGLLVQLQRAQQRGHDVVLPIVPAHLVGARWRFVCPCGTSWTDTADAEAADGQIRAPRRACVVCRTWVSGHVTRADHQERDT